MLVRRIFSSNRGRFNLKILEAVRTFIRAKQMQNNLDERIANTSRINPCPGFEIFLEVYFYNAPKSFSPAFLTDVARNGRRLGHDCLADS